METVIFWTYLITCASCTADEAKMFTGRQFTSSNSYEACVDSARKSIDYSGVSGSFTIECKRGERTIKIVPR